MKWLQLAFGPALYDKLFLGKTSAELTMRRKLRSPKLWPYSQNHQCRQRRHNLFAVLARPSFSTSRRIRWPTCQ